jgi:uncharacterized membrane protein
MPDGVICSLVFSSLELIDNWLLPVAMVPLSVKLKGIAGSTLTNATLGTVIFMSCESLSANTATVETVNNKPNTA